MTKEIFKIENGYLLKIGDKAWFYEDFPSCITNAFANEFEKLTDSSMCLTIESNIE